jgi:hypothetical protein
MEITVEDLDKIFFRVRDLKINKWYVITEEQSEMIRKHWNLLHDYVEGYTLSLSEDYLRIIKRKD